MLPTLNGRIQSRIFFLATIGAFWTFVMASILPATLVRASDGAEASVEWGDRLQDGFVALMWIAIFGVVWECIYHLLMQWRWEKDWPTFFGFITFINEGLLVWLLGNAGVLPGFVGRDVADQAEFLLPPEFFWPLFIVVWLMVWLFVNGPMRVFNIHWRFFGGRLV